MHRLPRCNDRRCGRTAGFTLLELLLVVAIAGIALGAVALSASGSDKRTVHDEAHRIALLLTAARDEAILRNQLIAFEATADRYRFLVHDGDSWRALTQDSLLHERSLGQDTHLAMASASEGTPLRIVFGREPVAAPFELALHNGASDAIVRADGIGHFSVE